MVVLINEEGNSLRQTVADWVPKALYLKFKHMIGRTQFYGRYSTWEEALAHSGKYADNIPVWKDIAKSESERAILRALPVAVGLLMPPLAHRVLDFGGGLGHLYYEMSLLFDPQWRVIDLPPIVECGNANFAGGNLSFHTSIDDAVRDFPPDVVVASGVLQVLPNPYDTVNTLVGIGAGKIILHRTLVADKERILIQRRPKNLGGGRHPIRFLEESRLLECFKGYTPVLSHDCGHRDGNLYGEYKYMSYIFVKSQRQE